MIEMRRRHVMTMSGAVITLIFLQFSCAGVKDVGLEEAPVAAEAAAEEDGLLAGTHKSAGISCNDCHAESPPAVAVSEAACLTCHEDYRDLTADLYEDPHNAHIAFQDCTDCHHIHQASENQCLACHAF